MASRSDVLGMSALAISVGSGVFYQFLPPFREIRKANDTDMYNDVRTGQVMSAIVVLTLGAILTSITKSKEPLMIAGITVAGLTAAYEYALRSHP